MILYFDTETTGLDYRRDYIRLFGYSTGGEPEIIDSHDAKHFVGEINSLFDKADIIVGFNLVFDLRFLNYIGVDVISHYRKFFDLYLGAKNIFNGLDIRLSLASLAKNLLNIDMDKSAQKSNWATKQLTAEQIEYAKNDVRVLPQLYDIICEKLAQSDLFSVAARDSRCAAIVACVSPFIVEQAEWRAYLQDLRRQEPEYPREFGSSLFGSPPFNPMSQKEVISFFRDLGISIESTDKYTLSQLDHPVARYVREYRTQKKLLQCFGEDYLIEHASNSELYCNLRVFGAETGRMSCDNPNIQQIPAAFRSFMRARDGESVIKADYSQIELRLVAEVSGDSEMLRAFKQGEDVHKMTAAYVLGDAAARKQAKALNFGLIYGMGPKKLVDYARTTYNVDFSLREADCYVKQFFEKYKGIASWHRKMKIPTRDYSVRTKLGRRRYLIGEYWPFTQAANTVIQGSAADGMYRALELVADRLLVPRRAKLLAVVHDEIVLSTRHIDSKEVRDILEQCMVEGMTSVASVVPIEVSSQILLTWK